MRAGGESTNQVSSASSEHKLSLVSALHPPMSARPSMSQVPSLAAVADPSPRYVDGPAVDYFVIEMVNTLRASSAVATARAKKVEQEMIDAGLMPTPAPALPALKKDKIRESMGSNASRSSISKDGQEGEEEELRARLEAIGMHVGANMAERSVSFAFLHRA